MSLSRKYIFDLNAQCFRMTVDFEMKSEKELKLTDLFQPSLKIKQDRLKDFQIL